MIGRKSATLFFINLSKVVVGLFSMYLIGHFLGPRILGVVAFGISFIGVFTFITDLGFGTSHIKRVSEGKDLGTCNGTFLTIKVFLITLLIIVFFISLHYSKENIDQEKKTVLYILLGYFVFWYLGDIGVQTSNAKKEIVRSSLPLLLESLARSFVIILVIVSALGSQGLAWAYLIGALAYFGSAMVFFRSYPIKKPSLEYGKSYLAFALPIMLLTVVTTVSSNLDKIIIQTYFSSEEVGYYFAPQKIIGWLSKLNVSVVTLLFPTVSEYHSKKEFESIRKVLFKAERYLVMVSLPVLTVLFIFAKEFVLLLLGPSFLQSTQIFRVLLATIFIGIFSMSYESVLMGIGRIGLVSIVSALSSVVSIALSLLFIPKTLFGYRLLGLGGFGAALASVVTSVFSFLLLKFLSDRLVKTKVNLRLLFHMFSALLTGIVLYVLKAEYPINVSHIPTILFGLLLYLTLAIVTYFSILTVVREFSRKDFLFLKDTINPKRMYDYIRSEIKLFRN